MSQESTITLERPTPKLARIIFANPPVNLIVTETVTRLDQIVRDLDDDPDIQVVVLTSGVPDFFFNHFDLAAAADFPVPDDENAKVSQNAGSERCYGSSPFGTSETLRESAPPASEFAERFRARGYRVCVVWRKLRGLRPTRRMKYLEKFEGSSKPRSRAMSATGVASCTSRRLASSTTRASMYSFADMPE